VETIFNSVHNNSALFIASYLKVIKKIYMRWKIAPSKKPFQRNSIRKQKVISKAASREKTLWVAFCFVLSRYQFSRVCFGVN